MDLRYLKNGMVWMVYSHFLHKRSQSKLIIPTQMLKQNHTLARYTRERNKHARQPRPENYEVPNCPSSFPFLKQFDKLMVQIYRIEPATKVGGTKQNQEYQILEEIKNRRFKSRKCFIGHIL